MMLALMAAGFVAGIAGNTGGAGAPPAISAQEQTGSVVTALLRDPAGRPWSGAVLHLHGAPGIDGLRAGEEWDLQLNAGAAGRVRAERPAPFAFSAWAIEELAEHRYRTTEVLEGLRGDAPIRLEAGPVRERVQLRFLALEAWQHEAPLRCEQHVGGERSLVRELKLGDQGSLRLPPFPGSSCKIRVRGKSGLVLLAQEVPQADPGSEPIELPIEAPRHLRIELKGKNGQALADAVIESGEIFTTSDPAWSTLAVTGEGGIYDLQIPLTDARLRRGTIRIRAPGHGWHVRASAWAQLPTEAPKKDAAPHLRISLQPAIAVRGRLMLDGERPAENWTVFALDSDPRRSDTIRTDREGRFVIEQLEPRRSLRLGVWLPPELQLRASASPRALVEPFAFIGVARGNQEDQDLGDLRLDRLVRLSLQFFAPDGQPARHASVAYGEHAKLGGIHRPILTQANRKGRLELLVPELEALELAAIHAGALAGAEIRTTQPGESRVVEAALTMPPSVTLRGTVRDSKGAPIAGATVHAYPMNTGSSPGARFLFALRRPLTVSDEDGRFAIVAPSPNLRYHLGAQVQDGERGIGSEPLLLDVENRDIDDIEIDVPFTPKAQSGAAPQPAKK